MGKFCAGAMSEMGSSVFSKTSLRVTDGSLHFNTAYLIPGSVLLSLRPWCMTELCPLRQFSPCVSVSTLRWCMLTASQRLHMRCLLLLSTRTRLPHVNMATRLHILARLSPLDEHDERVNAAAPTSNKLDNQHSISSDIACTAFLAASAFSVLSSRTFVRFST